MTESPPSRVRVTSPRTGARRTNRMPVTAEIDAQSPVGEVYMRSLIRAQLWLALRTLGMVAGALAAVPLLLHLAPALRTHEVAGIALPWLVLGGAVYPLVLLAGWWQVRASERAEADFTALVTGPARDDGGPAGAP